MFTEFSIDKYINDVNIVAKIEFKPDIWNDAGFYCDMYVKDDNGNHYFSQQYDFKVSSVHFVALANLFVAIAYSCDDISVNGYSVVKKLAEDITDMF